MKAFVVALVLATLPAGLFAQSLGEAAKKEREKREKQGNQKPVAPSFTDEDLKKDDPKAPEKGKDGKQTGSKESTPPASAAGNPLLVPLPNEAEVGPGAAAAARGGPNSRVRHRAYESTGEETEEELRAAQARDHLPATEGDDDTAQARSELNDRAMAAQSALKEAQDGLTPLQQRIDQIRSELSPMNPNFNRDPNHLLQLQAELTEAQKQLDAAQKQMDAAQQGWQAVLDAARRAGVSASELTAH
jgi:hypothetical protein